ncbi:MAG: hypothetical protein R3F65_15195 [bacterium]
MAALALQVEHGVDHVLEQARAGEVALLGDMADEEGDDLAALGERHEAGGDGAELPTLPGAPGCRRRAGSGRNR